MAPEAVYAPAAPAPANLYEKPMVTAPSDGPILAIGSPSTAEDGKYQSLITSLGESREVERYMVDRLIDGGVYFPLLHKPLVPVSIPLSVYAATVHFLCCTRHTLAI